METSRGEQPYFSCCHFVKLSEDERRVVKFNLETKTESDEPVHPEETKKF